jgi:hypothetical protein
LEVLDSRDVQAVMETRSSPAFKKYLLPGLIFQGVVIAGGYGTGRELIEYFMRFGLLGGLLGLFGMTLVCWALILAVTFEFSRKFRAYDYRTLLKNLLGRFWVVFEILYLVLLLTVLAVVIRSRPRRSRLSLAIRRTRSRSPTCPSSSNCP